MQRISGPTAPNNRFVAEDPLASQPGTIITAEWLNSVQEELANLLEKAGIPLDAANTSQLHELLNGRQAALTAPADLQPATGDTIEGDILAACDTPVGVAISTSKNHLYLCSGGRVQLAYTPDLEETATWASLHCEDGGNLTRCALVDGVFRSAQWTFGASWRTTEITEGTVGSTIAQLAQQTLVELTLVRTFVGNRFDAVLDTSARFPLFKAGWLVSSRQLVFVRYEADLTDGRQYLVACVQDIWGGDAYRFTAHEQEIVGGDIVGTDNFYREWLQCARVPLEGDTACRVILTLPDSHSKTPTFHLVAFTIEALGVSGVSTASFVAPEGSVPSETAYQWSPGLAIGVSTNRAVIYRRDSDLVITATVDGSSATFTELSLPDDESAAFLAHSTTGARPLLFGLAQDKWVVARIVGNVLEVCQRLKIDANLNLNLRNNWDEVERSRFPVPARRPVANIAGGAVVFLRDLCFASRTPEWGPWTVATALPAIPLGTDSGRLVALCPSPLRRTVDSLKGDAKEYRQTLTLCVSPPA